MMQQVLITLVFAAAILIDFVPKLRSKDKLKRECWIYGILMAGAYTILILVSFDVEVPSAFAPAHSLVQFLFGTHEGGN